MTVRNPLFSKKAREQKLADNRAVKTKSLDYKTERWLAQNDPEYPKRSRRKTSS